MISAVDLYFIQDDGGRFRVWQQQIAMWDQVPVHGKPIKAGFH